LTDEYSTDLQILNLAFRCHTYAGWNSLHDICARAGTGKVEAATVFESYLGPETRKATQGISVCSYVSLILSVGNEDRLDRLRPINRNGVLQSTLVRFGVPLTRFFAASCCKSQPSNENATATKNSCHIKGATLKICSHAAKRRAKATEVK